MKRLDGVLVVRSRFDLHVHAGSVAQRPSWPDDGVVLSVVRVPLVVQVDERLAVVDAPVVARLHVLPCVGGVVLALSATADPTSAKNLPFGEHLRHHAFLGGFASGVVSGLLWGFPAACVLQLDD